MSDQTQMSSSETVSLSPLLLSIGLLTFSGAKNSAFKEVLTRLEAHPDCRSLPMISFLILPMQRITRLPLLLDVSEPKAHSSPGLRNCKTFWGVTQRFVYLTARGARSNHRGVSVASRHSFIIPSDSFSLLRLLVSYWN